MAWGGAWGPVRLAAEMLFVLEVVLVAVCLALPVRLLFQPGFRRKLEAFPHAQALLVAGVALTAALLAAVALWWRPGFHFGALLAVSALAWNAVRARPHFGSRNGLPPGGLHFAPLAPWRDQEFFRKYALSYGPIFKFCHVHRPTICLVGLPLGHELLRTHAEQLTSSPLPFTRHVPRGFLRYMGDEDRKHFRAVLASALSRDLVQSSTPAITQRVREALPSVLLHRGGGAQGPPCLGTALHRMTAKVLMYFLFGSLEADEQQALKRAFDTTDFRTAARRSSRRIRRSLEEADAVLRQQVTRFRQSAGVPPASALEAVARNQPQMAEDSTILLNLFYMWQTASADVAGLLHWCLACLGTSAQWRERLREASAGDDALPLARAIVQETLRMEQSEYLIREVAEDFWYAGFRFPRGYFVRICVRESHRLDSSVAHADTFDPGRFLDGGLSRQQYSPFGTGARSCLGEQLTLVIGSIVLAELGRGYRWEVTDAGQPEFGGFHWRPGAGCRVSAVRL